MWASRDQNRTLPREGVRASLEASEKVPERHPGVQIRTLDATSETPSSRSVRN